MLFAKVCECAFIFLFVCLIKYLLFQTWGRKRGYEFCYKTFVIFEEIRSKGFENETQQPYFQAPFHEAVFYIRLHQLSFELKYITHHFILSLNKIKQTHKSLAPEDSYVMKERANTVCVQGLTYKFYVTTPIKNYLTSIQTLKHFPACIKKVL